MSEHQHERRKQPRLYLPLKIRCLLPLEYSGEEFECESYNISLGGLCLKSDREIRAGTVVSLEIQLPPGHPEHPPTIRIFGRIAWEMNLRESNYHHGIEFVDIEDPARDALHAFLAEHL